MKRLHISEAKAQGYIIDESAAGRPWAYKGPRFNPTATAECYTELETKLMALIPIAQSAAQNLPGSDLDHKASTALQTLPAFVLADVPQQ